MSAIGDKFGALIANTNDGGVAKLQILSYPQPDQSGKEEKFIAYYNPQTFNMTYAIEYDNKTPLGNEGSESNAKSTTPTNFSIELLIEGTGASLPTGFDTRFLIAGTNKVNVDAYINHFLKVAFEVEGTIHRPRYLLLLWGETLISSAVLTGLVVNKEVFDSKANTLRAKLQCTFQEYKVTDKEAAKKKLQSPDMTHLRTVQQGDKLPLMCERIYGDAKLYLEVARFNGLTNYRNLSPGQKIYFPPLIPTKP